jgi:ADP-ribosylglycohydrolase
MIKVRDITEATKKSLQPGSKHSPITQKITVCVFEEILRRFRDPVSEKVTHPLSEPSSMIITISYQYLTLWIEHIFLFQSLGDTIGYRNGIWEFNMDNNEYRPELTTEMIFDFISLGGINDISLHGWYASDDTIMYLATARALFASNDVITFGQTLKQEYLKEFPLLKNRHIGNTTHRSLVTLQNIDWDKLPYNEEDKGSGTSMRTGCLGIFFHGRHNRHKLIEYSVEASRITHNSAVGILGGVTAALFTAYALERVPVTLWPHKLLKFLRSGKVDTYMKLRQKEYLLFARDKIEFVGIWESYVNKRFNGLKPRIDLRIMENPVERIKYFEDNYGGQGFPGSRADDSLIMAYDSLLSCDGSLEKIIIFSAIHVGDSDTVASIALSWYAAVYLDSRILTISKGKLAQLEYYSVINKLINSPLIMDNLSRTLCSDIFLETGKQLIDAKIKKNVVI